MARRETTPTLDRPTPPVAPSRPDDALADVLAQQELDFAKAAASIFARDESTWSSGDWSILRRVGPHPGGSPSHDRARFNEWLARQTARHATIRAQQARAGSGADREAARQLAEQAAAALATEAPQIEAEIARLQSRLAALAQAAKQAESVVARQQAALTALRDESRLPSWVQDQLRALSRKHTEQWKRQLVQMRGRLAGIAAIVALSVETQQPEIQAHVAANRDLPGDSLARLNRFFETHVTTDKETQSQSTRVGRLNVSAWKAYVQELLDEAESIRPQIEALEPLEAAAQIEVERLRSFYAPE